MRIRKDNIIAFLMLLPSLILLGIFVYGFIGQTVYVSLTDWGQNAAQALAINPELAFVGLANYRDLFTGALETRFRQDLVNTFFFTIFFLAGCLGLGLGLAILLDQNVRGEAVFRTIFLFPFALAFIVTGTIWRWMLQPQGGLNVLPTSIGLPQLDLLWLASREQIWQFNWQNLPIYIGATATLVMLLLTYRAWRQRRQRALWVRGGLAVLFAALSLFVLPQVSILPFPETHGFNVAFIGIILAAVWQLSGYTMALYLAGLRGIPEALREAARVDGASEPQVYWHVVLPMLGPITLSAMIILGHISLKIFDLVFAMAGADNATTDVPALLMYLRSFRANQFAEGAAIAVVLLILVAMVIVPYLWQSLRGETKR
ncbi:MAG: sugar ABC transporter permease [Trueperaceae bacterium]|nr:sugar ABC transporter permease [Trueperaceae bacterium]